MASKPSSTAKAPHSSFEPPPSLPCTTVFSPSCATPPRLGQPAATALGPPPTRCEHHGRSLACGQATSSHLGPSCRHLWVHLVMGMLPTSSLPPGVLLDRTPPPSSALGHRRAWLEGHQPPLPLPTQPSSAPNPTMLRRPSLTAVEPQAARFRASPPALPCSLSVKRKRGLTRELEEGQEVKCRVQDSFE
jgi:hypothetical protein